MTTLLKGLWQHLQDRRRPIWLMAMILVALSGPSRAADISYVYDNLGRVIAVIDPATDTAVYAYDAVGNLTGITRQTSASLTIFQFTPSSGPVGRSVTIYGTGFSTTPASNTVKFNGTTATVLTATSTELTTTVPSGATTGPISVTVGSSMATSASPFTVGTPDAPIITGVSPTVGTVGTSVSMTGSNFSSQPVNNKVAFNGLLASLSTVTSTSLTTAVPSGATSGHVRVVTPYGSVTSTEDFFVPPSPYTAAQVGPTGRMAAGTSTTVTITSTDTIGLILFERPATNRVSLKISGVTLASTISIRDVNGITLGSTTTYIGGTLFIDAVALPLEGTYTILVAPTSSGATGSVTLTLYDVPADVTGPIVPGGAPVSVTTTVPGQNVSLTFAGTATQRVSLVVSGATYGSGLTYVYLKKPDGTTLASAFFTGASGFLDIQTLPTAGTYTILVDPWETAIGGATLQLYDVPADATGTITVGGAAVPITVSTPGQNASLTFTGTVNQQVTVHATSNTLFCPTVSLKSSNGSTLTSLFSCSASFDLAPQTLSTADTYTVVIDGFGATTGGMTISVTSP